MINANFTLVKKISAIFFLMLYAATSIGATVYTHYCMNAHVGTSLWHSENEKCGKCGMTEKQGKGCCKDEQKLVKLNSDHNLSVTPADLNAITIPAIVPPVFNFTEVLFISLASPVPGSHAPPDIGTSRNIMYCVVRI